MFAPMKKPVRIARDVDGGDVHCPVRLEMINPDTCEPCEFLSDTNVDSSGAITALVCTPTVQSMMRGE